MAFFSNPFKRKEPDQKPKKRSYAGAKVSNLLAKWALATVTINETVRFDLQALRARSRDLWMNDPIATRYGFMQKTNIVGPKGFIFSPAVVDKNGEPDEITNKTLIEWWADFSKMENCSTDDRQNLKDLCNSTVEGRARDGETICRMHTNLSYKYGLKIEIIDPDRIPLQLNKELPNGNRIIMGIEVDDVGKSVAYHIKVGNVLNNINYSANIECVRVDAEEIIHIGMISRPGQVRFVPDLAPVMTTMRHLGGLVEAEVVRARISSCKMGFFSSATAGEGDGPAGGLSDEKTKNGEFITDAEPGLMTVLPGDYTFQSFDPADTATQFGDIVKPLLRFIAAGLSVSYNSIFPDLEGVSFSSIRSGTVEERDMWRTHQTNMIDHFCMPIFTKALKMSLLKGTLKLSINDIERYKKVEFKGRGFDWIDPLRDIKAAAEAVALAVTTRSDICSQKGQDFDAVVEKLAREKKKLIELDLWEDFEKLDNEKNKVDDPNELDKDQEIEDLKKALEKAQAKAKKGK